MRWLLIPLCAVLDPFTGLLLLSASGVMVLTDFVIGRIAALAMFVARFAILCVWRQTVATCRWTEHRLMPQSTEGPQQKLLTSDAAVDPLSAV